MKIYIIPYNGELFKETRKSYFLKAFGEQVQDMRIIPFGKCNYSCAYCKRKGYEKNDGIIDGSVEVEETEIFSAINDAILNNQIVRLSGGDPVCYPELSFRLLKYVKKLNGITSIAHNGTGPNFVKSLIKADILDSISVDFKAPNPELLSEITGISLEQSKIMWANNLETLQILKANPQVKTDIRTCVFSNTNLEELLNIGNIIKENSNDSVFWTLRMYSIIDNYLQNTKSADDMKKIAIFLSTNIPDLKIGIRLKWDNGNFFYYMNGQLIDNFETEKTLYLKPKKY